MARLCGVVTWLSVPHSCLMRPKPHTEETRGRHETGEMQCLDFAFKVVLVQLLDVALSKAALSCCRQTAQGSSWHHNADDSTSLRRYLLLR